MEKYLVKQRVTWICAMDFTLMPQTAAATATAAVTAATSLLGLPACLPPEMERVQLAAAGSKRD